MPDLSSVATEAAERHAAGNIGCVIATTWFIEGFTECASRIPSEEEIAQVIAGELVDGDPRSAAEAVYALIGEKISG